MTNILDITKKKIERYLQDAVGTFEMGKEFYRVRWESTAVLIYPFLWGNDNVLVRISAVILRELKPSPAIHKIIADTNKAYMFGKLVYYEDDKLLFMEYYMLGDYLDKEELFTALRLLALTADELDDKLQAQLGGKRFVDP